MEQPFQALPEATMLPGSDLLSPTEELALPTPGTEPVEPTLYPIEGQEQLETLADEPVNLQAPHDPNILQTLVVACEVIEQLVDMSVTAQEEGISSHDIDALCQVQQRLLDNGLAVPPTPALEMYRGLFTPERSFVNKKVSIESIASVIIGTIKAWLKKLVEFVTDGYRWVQSLKHKHATLTAKLDKVREVVLRVREIYHNMCRLNAGSSYDLAKYNKEKGEAVLVQAGLAPNMLTLYGFGNKTAAARIADIQLSTLKACGNLSLRIAELCTALDSMAPQSPELETGLADVLRQVNGMTEVSSNPDYLIKALPEDYYDDHLAIARVSVLDYDPIVKVYGALVSELRKVQNVKLGENRNDSETIRALIDNMTKALNDINVVIDFLNAAALSQVAGLKVYYKYYGEAIQMVDQEFRRHEVTDDTRKAFNKLADEVRSLKV